MKTRGSKASFNDLFSRPLAIVGNTGSGKSYTVASLLRSVIENDKVSAVGASNPHIFILDINGEYANAFLPEEERKYTPEPNQEYVNGKKLSVPVWLINAEEVCEWLSASEQTQQPVLKAWWAFLKGRSIGEAKAEADFLGEALGAAQRMYPLNALSKNQARNIYLAISNFLSGTGIDLNPLTVAITPYLAKQGTEYKNFYGDIVDNGVAINAALAPLIAAIEDKIAKAPAASAAVQSGDTPMYFSTAALRNTATLTAAASQYPLRDRVIVLLSVKARLRAAEIANLTWEMVLDPNGAISTALELRDRAAKKGHGRIIPLHASLREALSVLREKSEPSRPVVLSERGSKMKARSIVIWFIHRQAQPGLCLSNGSTVFFREHVRIEVGDPLLAFLRDLQIPECIADIGADGLPEESRVGCPQIIRGPVSKFLARAGLPEFCK